MILTILANDDNNKKQKTGGNDNNNRYNEKEDPRYITQTYKFSLDTLNEYFYSYILKHKNNKQWIRSIITAY
ncbi:uncharacterized protein OCT59_022314 [Rhizophagus irregularis]|uniref:uncharacterized protein n=1 Tax=Rhizophagus irregularis TaxID=588596 RepID=UPI001A040110|nr:hypothetical protein OCT59_022314 [Rhizophagus irregularis]GET56373.1 hypothetical protein GLOIN_2v1785517 [Rhizophagus irregularis DAOM 181602=DAOM 197198]